MINILSWVGMTMQSEACMWTMLGLITTIFDATLFKVNSNLKQVWQMKMPDELTLPMQRVLRMMISGVMLVQCFTVYVYLSTYIVLLYPVFLEERPTLVLPWLLLAAVRKLLCELTSLAMGLGSCVLLGASRPPCIRFVIIKILSIMPSFYMWMLMFNYYHVLKLASAFKSYATATTSSDNDEGLELAVRRRRTKSLFDEDSLRRNLMQNLYKNPRIGNGGFFSGKVPKLASSEEDLQDPQAAPFSFIGPLAANKTFSEIRISEDFIGTEIVLPRATDRVMEQFVMMLLQIGAYKQKTGDFPNQISDAQHPLRYLYEYNANNMDCSQLETGMADTSPQVDNSDQRAAEVSYITDFPKIFMRRNTTSMPCSTRQLKSTQTQIDTDDEDILEKIPVLTNKSVSNDTTNSYIKRKHHRHSRKGGRNCCHCTSGLSAQKVTKREENSTSDIMKNVYTNIESVLSVLPPTTGSEIRPNSTNKENMNNFETKTKETNNNLRNSDTKVTFPATSNVSSEVETESKVKSEDKKNG